MAAGRSFPWRWVIACLAVAVIAMTVLVQPPGTVQDVESADETVEAGFTEENEPVVEVCVPDTIRVMVLNGTSTDGLATRTQRELLGSSTDSTVILAPFDPSNTEIKPYEETIIISHLTDTSAARVIADILGMSEDCIVWEVPAGNTPVFIDITICLGEDEVLPIE
jgi:hypothetical protein